MHGVFPNPSRPKPDCDILTLSGEGPSAPPAPMPPWEDENA
jgi:hypothetical protein